MPLGPEARYEQIESISLAFVTALQLLPPRQLAVLILRDVLGFHAVEVAEMLDAPSSRSPVRSNEPGPACERRLPVNADRAPAPAAGSPAEDAIVAKFVRAYEAADLDALVALLTDDVFMSMPPIPFEYEGRSVVARFYRRHLRFGPEVQPGADAGQRSAGVRSLRVRARRHPQRDGPVRA